VQADTKKPLAVGTVTLAFSEITTTVYKQSRVETACETQFAHKGFVHLKTTELMI
jgi:hypothetical protein